MAQGKASGDEGTLKIKATLAGANLVVQMSDVDIERLLTEIGVLTGEPVGPVPADTSVADRFLAFIRDRETSTDFVERLFPAGIDANAAFFDRLADLRNWIGVGQSADEAIGQLWSTLMHRLPVAGQEDVLTAFVEQDVHEVFDNLQCLPLMLETCLCPPEFLATWLPRLAKKIERDAAQGGFWKAVTAICEKRTAAALRIIRLLADTPDSPQIRLAAFMLGSIRTQELADADQTEFHRIEEFFASHATSDIRSVFDWSWITTASSCAITETQLKALFARAESGVGDDQNNVIGVVSRIVISDKSDEAVIRLGFEWLNKTVSPSISQYAKYNLCYSAAQLAGGIPSDGIRRPDGFAWILAIQPVDLEDEGTWGAIQRYLVHLLKTDLPEFSRAFEQLAETNAAALNEFIVRRRAWDWFLKELSDVDVTELVGYLATSVKTDCRRLGIELFDELGAPRIPNDVFERNGSRCVRLLFYEMQRMLLNPRSIARLLISMLPHLDETDDDFRAQFNDELRLQIRNFAGGCREELEMVRAESTLVGQALDEVQASVEALKPASDSGVNAMEVAGHRRAIVLYRRRFARQVTQSAAKSSTLVELFFARPVQLLYGQLMGAFVNGSLQDARPTFPLSGQLEVPVVDFFDPEEMAMRRLQAAKKIAELSVEFGDKLPEA